MRLPVVLVLAVCGLGLSGGWAHPHGNMHLRGGEPHRAPSEERKSSIRVISRTDVPSRPLSDLDVYRFTWRENGRNVKSVQVVGSWSRFKERTDMRQAHNGDWMVELDLPSGQHELKFILDGTEWVCSPDLPTKLDARGVQNNIIEVSKGIGRSPSQINRISLAAVPTQAPPPPHIQEPVKDETGIFVPRKSTIEQFQGLVQQMEKEKQMAQQRLEKAQAQLVETMLLDLGIGLKNLESSKADVAKFSDIGKKGPASILESAEAKVTQIQQQAAALHEVLTRMEAESVQAVQAACQQRVSQLDTQLNLYNQTIPEITMLMHSVSEAMSDASKAPEKFVGVAQMLLNDVGRVSEKACTLKEPKIDVSFESIKQQADQQMQGVLKSASGTLKGASSSTSSAAANVPTRITGQ